MHLLFSILAMNLYVWWKLRCAFLRSLSPWLSPLLLTVIMVLATLPITIRVFFGRQSDSFAASSLTFLCWLWLIWSFWGAACFLCCDGWNLLARLLPPLHTMTLSVRTESLIVIGWIVSASLTAAVSATRIQTKTVEIFSPKIPAEADQTRLALISDVHLSSCLPSRTVSKMVTILQDLHPDILVNTGDFLDRNSPREEALAGRFYDVQTPCRFSVLGNHECYAGLEDSLRLHEAAAFHVLRNEGIAVNDWLFLFGVDDPAANRRAIHSAMETQPPFATPDAAESCRSHFSILLQHRPEPHETARSQFDLMLSGHTHGGQIFPFNLLVRLRYPFGTGLTSFPEGLRLYTSPGTGTWGPPFRLFAPPEITLFIFRHEQTPPSP